MKRIDLHIYYPNLPADSFLDVADEVFTAMKRYGLEDDSHYRRMRYHKVLSLNANDGVENHILHFADSPEDAFLWKVSLEQLREALDQLTPTQRRRVYAYYILGKNVCKIARAESTFPASVSESITRGLRNLKRYYEQRAWLP